jgi:7,8-dihydropterin-6-yl-methyl-4-(beta-D-ribofuranosyl)aminobenzene 5'-phosphate synthase
MGDFLAQWGLSILVETDEANVLLDTGRSISATYNADTLEIDLNKVDKIVLTHSHYDHTGGLHEVLRRIRKSEIEIIAHPDVWSVRYNRREDKPDKYMGMPFPRQELENLGAIFNLTTKPVRITDNITTSGEVPMVTDFETVESEKTKRFIKRDTGLEPDKILDDLAIFIETEQGLVVITGCAHRGIINTLYHAQQVTGVKRIHAVIGGSHLHESPEDRIHKTIMALKELDVQKLGLCHCTGPAATYLMAYEFGDKFIFNHAGTVTELP